jgi:AraC-like DNA-binding protein
MRAHRYADRFSVVHVETTGPLAEAVHKSSSVDALLVSLTVRPIAAINHRLWVDGKLVTTGRIPAFRANVIDLAAEPAIWANQGVHYVHFHVRRAAVDEAAKALGYERMGGFRVAIAQQDIVLAQITKTLLPALDRSTRSTPLALDQLELIVGAHIVQRYGASHLRRPTATAGLAAWQRRRATELLRENLDGKLRLAALAGACDLSVSHFARCFRASFGVSCHGWLTERRLERARELLARTNVPLVEVATQSGFADQAAFTRTFRRVVGEPPGQWRREHGARGARRRK